MCRILGPLFFILVCLCEITLASQLPQDLRMALLSLGYIVPLESTHEGANFYVFRLEKNNQHWALKVPKKDTPEAFKNMQDEFDALLRLGQKFCPAVQQIESSGKKYLLKGWILGESLLSLTKRGIMENRLELRLQLRDLFDELNKTFPGQYVTDLHGENLVWSEGLSKWVIIDSNGIRSSPMNSAIFYYNEQKDHWAGEPLVAEKMDRIMLNHLKQKIAKFSVFCQKEWSLMHGLSARLIPVRHEKFCFQITDSDTPEYLSFDPRDKRLSRAPQCSLWEGFSISESGSKYMIHTFNGERINAAGRLLGVGGRGDYLFDIRPY